MQTLNSVHNSNVGTCLRYVIEIVCQVTVQCTPLHALINVQRNRNLRTYCQLYTCYELIMLTNKSEDINEFIYGRETWGSLVKSTL